MNNPTYIVGIDLGTTHCVLAYAPVTPADATETSGDGADVVTRFAVPQVVSPGEVKALPLLPSFLLLPGPHDVPDGALALPWDPGIDLAVGEYARERGAELPARLVASAKSWLSNAGVDRTAAILPWDAPEDARRVSPVAAMATFMRHLTAAWDAQMAAHDPSLRLAHQEIYLTVPASFDAVARELTVQAAREAGLHNFTLLEEPQAAFYAWIDANQASWRNAVHVGESILVCDVGGGTTDFSLIQVVDVEGNLELQRVAVGDHILLGGDNMDLTLAYAVQAKLAQRGTKLDTWQFRTLWHHCRKAKERLLNDPTLAAEPIAILGRGSSLIGGTIRTELTRDEIQAVLLAGFFPEGGPDDVPQEQRRVGIREMGLPYAADPAITRHLAQFLQRHAVDHEGRRAYPGAVLFNGGVMKAEPLRARILDVLRAWSGNPNLRELDAVDLDQSVALGASYYGLARQGRGLRIRAGASRAYYIGVESAMPAVPGIPTPVNALCVVPFGMEEGAQEQIRRKEFGLVVGEPAVFQLLASTTHKDDRPGEIIEDWSGDLQEVTTMETLLPATDQESAGAIIPVWLESKMTEIGTLELWCVARDGERRWRLEFSLRDVRDEDDW